MKIVAIVLMLVMICAIVFSVLQFCMPAGRGIKPSEWFGGTTTDQPKDPDENREDLIADENGGLAISQDKKPNGAARLSATKIAEEDYEENGVSPQAETAVTISIIDIEPANATELLADWSATFLTESNEEYAAWAEGKEVADYVTVTPAENTLSAVVECTAPFGAQIEVQAQFRTGDKITLSCVCDYVQNYTKAEDFELKLSRQIDSNTWEEVDEIYVCDRKNYKLDFKLISLGTKFPSGIKSFGMLNYGTYTMSVADLGAIVNSQYGSVNFGNSNYINQFDETTFGKFKDGLTIIQLKDHCDQTDSYFTSHNMVSSIDQVKHIKITASGPLFRFNESTTGGSGGSGNISGNISITTKFRLNFDQMIIDVSNAKFDKTHVDLNA